MTKKDKEETLLELGSILASYHMRRSIEESSWLFADSYHLDDIKRKIKALEVAMKAVLCQGGKM